MTPEEKFDNKIWEILQKIKEGLLFNNTQEINWKESKYNSDHKAFVFDKGEKAVLDKIEGMKAIEIKTGVGVLAKLPQIDDPNYSIDEIFVLYKNGGIATQYLNLKVVQPKFDEIYNRYKRMNIAKETSTVKRPPMNHLERLTNNQTFAIIVGGLLLLIIIYIIFIFFGLNLSQLSQN
ncbi:MAG: hypothetical protein WC621_01385 [Patescibacteria group bacterium]